MQIGLEDLDRFKLGRVLGEGADLQVFAAIDTERGREVVVKRPHPTLIERSLHDDIERRVEQVTGLRLEMGDSLPHVSRLVGLTLAENHDSYFGDSLGQSYTVTVEERARGLPLVGSPVDSIKGMPIGLPQNLFALHPLVPHSDHGILTVVQDVLDVAEAFYRAGLLVLDLRPENVFFAPGDGVTTVIDLGTVTPERPATRRHDTLDLHDFYMEMFKWYTTPSGPHQNATDYGEPHGVRSVSMFRRDVDGLIAQYSREATEPMRTVAVDMLEKVRGRRYPGLVEFRRDFEHYTTLAQERYAGLAECNSLVAAWRGALDMLRDPAWGKFLFDARTDLVSYRADR